MEILGLSGIVIAQKTQSSLRATVSLLTAMSQENSLPRRNHYKIIRWLNFQQLIECVVSTGDDYGRVLSQVGSDDFIE
jgi:hypothetical protein